MALGYSLKSVLQAVFYTEGKAKKLIFAHSECSTQLRSDLDAVLGLEDSSVVVGIE